MSYPQIQLSALLVEILSNASQPMQPQEILKKATELGFTARNNNQALGRILRTLTNQRHLFTSHPSSGWTLKANRHHELNAQLMHILIAYLTSEPQPHTPEHLHRVIEQHLPTVTLRDIKHALSEPTFTLVDATAQTYTLQQHSRPKRQPRSRKTTATQQTVAPQPHATQAEVGQVGESQPEPLSENLPPAVFNEVADTLERAQQPLTITDIKRQRNVDPTHVLNNYPNAFTHYDNDTWGLTAWDGTILPLIDNYHPLTLHIHAIMHRRTKGISPAKLADQLNQHPSSIKQALEGNPRIFTSTRRARIGSEGTPNDVKRLYSLTEGAQVAAPRSLLPGLNRNESPQEHAREKETPEERMRRELFG